MVTVTRPVSAQRPLSGEPSPSTGELSNVPPSAASGIHRRGGAPRLAALDRARRAPSQAGEAVLTAMAQLVQGLLQLHGWSVYLVVAALTFVESAAFVGFRPAGGDGDRRRRHPRRAQEHLPSGDSCGGRRGGGRRRPGRLPGRTLAGDPAAGRALGAPGW